MRNDLSNTRSSVSSDIQTPRSKILITRRSVSSYTQYREMIHQTQELVCHLDPVVQKIDNAIHRINHYPVDRDLSDGLCYPPFEQPRPDI